MTINILGDSITQGIGASCEEKGFVSLLAKTFPDDTFLNYGLGGTRIARQEDFFEPFMKFANHDQVSFNLDFNLRIVTMNKNADLIFVFGGTNDFGHGSAPIGNDEDNTPYTFIGALKLLIKTLIKTYGKEKIIFILPLHRFDEDSTRGSGYVTLPDGSPTLIQYVSLIIKYCNEYGIKFLDFGNVFTKPNSTNNEGLFFDGLHPNDNGHHKLCELLAKEITELKENRKNKYC